MADIQIFETANVQEAGYFDKDECITLTMKWAENSFSCVWTPKLPPLVALNKLQSIGIISRKLSRGDVKLEHTEFTTEHWKEALRRVAALKNPRIHHIRLGTDHRSIALEQSGYVGYGLCCAVRGDSWTFGQFGTALMLTAPRSLIDQFNAMHYRLVSHPASRRAFPQSG